MTDPLDLDGMPWLRAGWPAPRGVHGLTTLRHGAGVSQAPFDTFNMGNCTAAEGDDPADVARNRDLLVAHARLPSEPRWLRQVHGVGVVRFGLDVPPMLLPEADASVTSEPGVVLAILTADCLPVLFCVDDGSEVAAAHAGWRGLADGVLEATVAAMRTPPDRVRAWLGPAAGPQRYEVGVDVYDAFVSRDWAAGSAFTSTREHHWHVDLYALARRRLAAAGIAPDRVSGGDLCTLSAPDRFYSHRRDRRTGRMVSLVWMEPGR
ncbi:peptidoglycan editing factor PgeF [Aerolutibacter ruishenii]|uniref:Purine nucleoside phosphorylase n=1 Tax=Aerolutibacter ruishenii TaxID=686800 RepID=A0A562M3H0_9GAMM|nr:peptidoglycan editing factor PgeF [Lysobacter ruishenii]TWI14151.1 hypothetical protein IP93_00144 [Lysobacter ruishenii]